MILDIILAIVLLILMVFCDASRDRLSYFWSESIYAKYPKLFPQKFWNPTLSWKNKWVLDENGNPKLDENGDRIPKKWFGLIDIPDALTDGWHVLKAISWTAILIIIAVNLIWFSPIVNFLILSAIYLITWWLFFDILLNTKKKKKK